MEEESPKEEDAQKDERPGQASLPQTNSPDPVENQTEPSSEVNGTGSPENTSKESPQENEIDSDQSTENVQEQNNQEVLSTPNTSTSVPNGRKDDVEEGILEALVEFLTSQSNDVISYFSSNNNENQCEPIPSKGLFKFMKSGAFMKFLTESNNECTRNCLEDVNLKLEGIMIKDSNICKCEPTTPKTHAIKARDSSNVAENLDEDNLSMQDNFEYTTTTVTTSYEEVIEETEPQGGSINVKSEQHGSAFNAKSEQHGSTFNAKSEQHGSTFNAESEQHGSAFNVKSEQQGKAINVKSEPQGRAINLKSELEPQGGAINVKSETNEDKDDSQKTIVPDHTNNLQTSNDEDGLKVLDGNDGIENKQESSQPQNDEILSTSREDEILTGPAEIDKGKTLSRENEVLTGPAEVGKDEILSREKEVLAGPAEIDKDETSRENEVLTGLTEIDKDEILSRENEVLTGPTDIDKDELLSRENEVLTGPAEIDNSSNTDILFIQEDTSENVGAGSTEGDLNLLETNHEDELTEDSPTSASGNTRSANNSNINDGDSQKDSLQSTCPFKQITAFDGVRLNIGAGLANIISNKMCDLWKQNQTKEPCSSKNLDTTADVLKYIVTKEFIEFLLESDNLCDNCSENPTTLEVEASQKHNKTSPDNEDNQTFTYPEVDSSSKTGTTINSDSKLQENKTSKNKAMRPSTVPKNQSNPFSGNAFPDQNESETLIVNKRSETDTNTKLYKNIIKPRTDHKSGSKLESKTSSGLSSGLIVNPGRYQYPILPSNHIPKVVRPQSQDQRNFNNNIQRTRTDKLKVDDESIIRAKQMKKKHNSEDDN